MVGQIRRERGQSVVPAFRPPVLDGDVAALDVPGFREAVVEGADAAGEGSRRFGAEIPDHRHPRLLRLPGKRPHSGRAAQRHHLPPLHSTLHHRELRSGQSLAPIGRF
jgi:hypothetical protein